MLLIITELQINRCQDFNRLERIIEVKMLHRINPRLCRAVTNTINQKRTTIIVKRVHKPPLIGTDPFKTPQKVLDEAVTHTDDDKWMLYEEELQRRSSKVLEKHSLKSLL